MRQQRIEEEAGELAIILGIVGAELVLGTRADDQFVNQRVAFAVDLHEIRIREQIGAAYATNCYLGPRGGSVGSEYSLFLTRAVKLAIHGEHGDGDFEHDRVDVIAGHGVGRVVVLVVGINRWGQYATDTHAEIERVEGCSQVDEEWIVHRTGEDPHVAPQIDHPLVEERVVVRHGQRADIRRNRIGRLAFGQVGGYSVLDHGDGVRLAKAKTFRTRAAQGRDLGNSGDSSDKSGEDPGQLNLGCETKLERDVRHPVLIVVDFHFVQDIGIERKIVGPVGRLKEGIDVENHGDAIRMVVAYERVPIGNVGCVIKSGDWRFAMAGGKHAGRNQHEYRHREGHE